MNRAIHFSVLVVGQLACVATSHGQVARTVDVSSAASGIQAKSACSTGDTAVCGLRIYQVMVESFVDGDPRRNYGTGYGSSHHRGDLKGITDSLDYIAGLGSNAIWLTPIFDSHAGAPQQKLVGTGTDRRLDATGYYTRDYFSIDPKFGSLEDARELVNKAHEKGLYVFFDGVFGHHKGGLIPSPTGKLPVNSVDPDDYFGYPQFYPGRVVDYDYPETLEFYKEVATYWIDELGIDGWRLDQAFQIPVPALHDIQTAIREASSARARRGEQWGTLGYAVGEIWSGAEQISEFAFGSDAHPGLDSAFDFPVRYATVQVLAGEEGPQTGLPASTLNAFWSYGAHDDYPDHALPNLMIGNHDLVRFGDLLQRHDIAEPDEEEYWDRHRLAFMVQTAYSGPITRYYGEEIGDELPGFSTRVENNCVSLGRCDDHVGRTSAKILGVTVDESDLSSDQLALMADLQNLMALRANHISLSHGSRQHLYSDDDIYIDLKSFGGEQIVFAMNTSDEIVSVSLNETLFDSLMAEPRDLLGASLIERRDGAVHFDLAPLSGSFLLVAVPEPSTVATLLVGLLLSAARTLRRRRGARVVPAGDNVHN